MRQSDQLGETSTKGFEDLKAWQMARRLMVECHRVAESLPTWERYDLAPQMRQSSKSTMANIAEGYGRYHYLDSLRFYYFARGSLTETINHVIAAYDLGYIDARRHQELYDLGCEDERALNGYIAFIWKQRQGQANFGERLITESSSYNTVAPAGFSIREVEQLNSSPP